MNYPDCLSEHEQQQFDDSPIGAIQRAEQASRQRAFRVEREIEHGFERNEHGRE